MSRLIHTSRLLGIPKINPLPQILPLLRDAVDTTLKRRALVEPSRVRVGARCGITSFLP